MDILVFVKQVPDDYVEIRLDPATGKPATAAAEQVANAFDTYAAELAVRWCEANGGSVTAAVIGPESAKNTLKNLLAVGVSKAFLFDAPGMEEADAAAVAERLAAAAEKCAAENGAPYGLILCGKESTDEICGQVGAMLAERLGLGFVSSVIEVAPREGGLTAKQETEEGYILYETASPAVYTVAKPGYDPRYPTIKSKMTARKAVIPVFPLDAAPAARVVCTGYSEPPRRKAGTLITGDDAAETALRAVAAMAADKVI